MWRRLIRVVLLAAVVAGAVAPLSACGARDWFRHHNGKL